MFEAKGVEGFCTRGEEGEGQFFFHGGEARKMVVGKQEEDGVGCNELHTMSCTYIHTTHTTPCTLHCSPTDDGTHLGAHCSQSVVCSILTTQYIACSRKGNARPAVPRKPCTTLLDLIVYSSTSYAGALGVQGVQVYLVSGTL